MTGMATALVSTWRDGVLVFAGETHRHELAGTVINALASDGHGRALAIVSGNSLRRRTGKGEWATLATSEFQLACCAAVGDAIYLGTDDARVLRVDVDGGVEHLSSFDTVPGRDRWYAGSAVIDGQRVGPPLGIRSIASTADGRVLLANVHVGGVPRSTDGGATWQPTIDIDADVHEVCAHPTKPHIVVAAAAVGCCVSRDGGETWSVEHDGLHGHYCSAATFFGDDVLVGASTDHFAPRGAVYGRAVDAPTAFARAAGGLPPWTDGIVDTRCIAARDAAAAFADQAGNLYVTTDSGRTWSCRARGLPAPSSVLVV